jgi:hypothetical protein
MAIKEEDDKEDDDEENKKLVRVNSNCVRIKGKQIPTIVVY